MESKNDVIIGDLIKSWQSGKCVNITLCMTEDCNMACKYCYMVNKNNKRSMTYEMAKKIVDFVMTNEEYTKNDAVVFDFIGGEPLLKIDVIDRICDYIVVYMYKNGHKWFEKYRFMITTNGLLYSDPLVQKFINKHIGHISLTISIDGTKEKQNISRVKRDGSGTYDDVVKNVPLWLKQFPTAFAKSTFTHNDLPFLKDSIAHLWSLGIKNVMANIVYENVWEEGDDQIFEEQLNMLADYIIDNDLWDKYSVRFFNPNVGLPLSTINKERNVCGAGVKTVAFDCDGNIFPCIRFLDFCMNGEKSKCIGNINTGINFNELKAFSSLTVKSCSNSECLECDVSQSCDFCTAFNYISSKNHTIFERTTFNCKMHKANVRANNRIWYKYSQLTKSTSPRTKIKLACGDSNTLKYLKILLSDAQPPHCAYANNLSENFKMGEDIIDRAIDFCYKHFLIPIFIGDKKIDIDENDNILFRISSGKYLSRKDVYIFDPEKENDNVTAQNAIIVVNKSNIKRLFNAILLLSTQVNRINIFIQDLDEWEEHDVDNYSIILDEIINSQKNIVSKPVLNIFSNSEQRCGAGVTSITLAPDGNFYLCPAFYYNNMKNHIIGSIYDDPFKYKPMSTLKANSFYQELEGCNHLLTSCIFNNYVTTGEMNIPSYIVDRLEQLHFEKGLIYNSI
mgnify:FL=1